MNPTTDRFFIVDYETTGVKDHDVPIEMGVMITDSNWNELERAESLISSSYAAGMNPTDWTNAERFHGISQRELVAKGQSKVVVAGIIESIASLWKPHNGRLILLSDNVQFEWNHTQWLLTHIGLRVQDLFHYCGWDTSILSLFTSFEDPTNTKHRAMSDVEGLVEELRRLANKRRH